MMSSHDLEQCRRSLVMAPPDHPAVALTNREALALIYEVVQSRTRVANLDPANNPNRDPSH